ncbi:MAG: T9SS type A sorting domain-containing protein [Bacteroidota bacterium]
MKIKLLHIISISIVLVFFSSIGIHAQSLLPCDACHTPQFNLLQTSKHSMTQNDIASELAANWAGQTPDSVISGSSSEDCVACHSPLAVTANGGMTETQVMGHFFTTTGGMYTDSTKSADSANWPHLWCTTCHDVPSHHPSKLPSTAIFNSTTAVYDSLQTASMLCGKCHGTLRFSETDHRIYDAWKMSKHGQHGQQKVAGELAVNWAGNTPNDVINGPDAEDCVACHAPTAVKSHGDTTEVMVLQHFFTTTGGTFTAQTGVADSSHWPEVACNTCHDPHKPDTLSYYNSSTRSYMRMSSANQQCGQCHGNLRFPGTDHLSYNIESGTGGIGVPDKITMAGAECISCHMHKGAADGTNSLMYKGHRWSVYIDEPDGSTSNSCVSCHAGMTTDSAMAVVANWQSEFATLDSIAQVKVTLADTFMVGVNDSVKSAYLAEAHHNLKFAESDESGGFHNHAYSISLLNDAISKSTSVITGIKENSPAIPKRFMLAQSYPNPFNPTASIAFEVAAESRIHITIFDELGREITSLLDMIKSPGSYVVPFDASGLSSGVYFYRLEATGTADQRLLFSQVKKMVLLR